MHISYVCVYICIYILNCQLHRHNQPWPMAVWVCPIPTPLLNLTWSLRQCACHWASHGCVDVSGWRNLDFPFPRHGQRTNLTMFNAFWLVLLLECSRLSFSMVVFFYMRFWYVLIVFMMVLTFKFVLQTERISSKCCALLTSFRHRNAMTMILWTQQGVILLYIHSKQESAADTLGL